MICIRNYSIKEFKELINKKEKIICFCAGQEFINFCKAFNAEERVIYVVDNYKSGRTICINGCIIPVISMEEVGNKIEDVVLVITSIKYANEIIVQLDDMMVFDQKCFYFPYFFSEQKKNEIVEFEKGSVQKIPRKIHYCWFGKNPMPKQFQKNILTWERICPDYEIIRWDESNYDIEKNKYMKQAYEKMKWGFVPDYARLDIINTNGGIYLDTDVEVLKPFDDLLTFDFFCGFESNRFIALGLGFGASSNNPILYDMMKTYDQISFINDDGSLNMIPSPVHQTKIIEKCGFKINGNTQILNNSIILAPEYLAPINAVGIGEPTINSYSIHQYAATWYSDEQAKEKKHLLNNINLILERMKE